MDQGYGRPITAGNGDAHARPIVDVRIDDAQTWFCMGTLIG